MKAEIYDALWKSLEDERLVAVTTVVVGKGVGRQMVLWPSGATLGDLGSENANTWARESVQEAFDRFASRRETVDAGGEEIDLFIEVHPPRPRLIVVGAGHVAIPLVAFAKTLGFRTHVVDPRSVFATEERFAHADELIVAWPQEALERIGLNESTYVAVLSHDLKIDVPALALTLRSPARYVGVLGSKKTHAKRVAALREAGLGDDEIARVHAPIGIDLGAKNPEEIAVAIIAEIVAASHGLRTDGGRRAAR